MPARTGRRVDHNGHSLIEIEVRCGECGAPTGLVDGATIHPRRADLAHLRFYACGCGAYVGVHAGTLQPLGTPAGPATRAARTAVHRVFDPLWRDRADASRTVARRDAYRWLADRLGIRFEDCHIGMMDRPMVERARAACMRGQAARSMRRIDATPANVIG